MRLKNRGYVLNTNMNGFLQYTYIGDRFSSVLGILR